MTKNLPPVEYIDRKSGERVRESVMGDGALRFAYETLLGRTLWPVLFGSKFCSAVMGRRYDSPRSRKSIAALAAIPGCRADEAEKPVGEYSSFNEFFTRRLKPGARPVGDGFVSPADGRLRLFLRAEADAPFPLKGARKSLREVFGPAGAPAVPGGLYDIAVVRLAPVARLANHLGLCESVCLHGKHLRNVAVAAPLEHPFRSGIPRCGRGVGISLELADDGIRLGNGAVAHLLHSETLCLLCLLSAEFYLLRQLTLTLFRS